MSPRLLVVLCALPFLLLPACGGGSADDTGDDDDVSPDASVEPDASSVMVVPSSTTYGPPASATGGVLGDTTVSVMSFPSPPW